MRTGRNKLAGFTLIEFLIGAVLFGIISYKVTVLVRSASRFSTNETQGILLEDASREVMRRIGYMLMGANRQTLVPEPNAPLFSSAMRFQVSLGTEDGEVVWSDPEQIVLEDGDLVWKRAAGLPEEQRVVWSRLVQELLEGETLNGIDDNGNGLVDEQGLSFVLDGDSVEINLSLGREDSESGWLTETKTLTVTCRNKALVSP